MLLFDWYSFVQGRTPALPVPGSRKPNLDVEFLPSCFNPLCIIQGQQESETAR